MKYAIVPVEPTEEMQLRGILRCAKCNTLDGAPARTRADALDELVAEAQALGLYDTPPARDRIDIEREAELERNREAIRRIGL